MEVGTIGGAAALTTIKAADRTVDVARAINKFENLVDAERALNKVDNVGDGVRALEKGLGEVPEKLGPVTNKVDNMGPGSPAHKSQRWEDYQNRGGEWDYDRWSKTYDNNMQRARKANEAVDKYHETLGWGKREVTVDVNGDARRLDIADITAQLLPQINPKIMKNLSPYDGLAVALEGEEFKKQNREIDVEITTLKVTFVPLGIPDFNGNVENEYLKFNINITENPAEKMTVEVFKNGQTHYKEEITSGNMLGVGNHEWKWDGFGEYGDYNSKSFKEDEITVVATVWLDGQEKSHRTVIDKKKPIGKDWVDVSISRNIKEITVYLKVNLRDGGERGLDKAGKIPKQSIAKYKRNPITSRTISFETLRSKALNGVETYWSRNDKSRAKKTLINGEDWRISVKAEQTEDGMSGPKIIFWTNKIQTDFNRSHNIPGARKLFYDVGYLKDNNWEYETSAAANDWFELTSAHEIGHEVLLAYGNFDHSVRHKGSSTLLQDPIKNNPFPNNEIDLMKYYSNKIGLPDIYKRTVASTNDVMGLIWLTKMKIK